MKPQEIRITDEDIEEASRFFDRDFSDPERKAVLTCTTTQDIQACPGSGKTTLLVAKLAILANKWQWPDQGICVLSHTNVARKEVEKRVAHHPSAHQLLGYPHFIGTIQAFIDQFLALPYLKSKDRQIICVDNERFEKRAVELVIGNKGKFRYLSKRWKQYKSIVEGLRWRYEDTTFALESAGGEIGIDPKRQTFEGLVDLKQSICDEGIYRYDDMYAYAEACVDECPEIIDAIRLRFPWVFIDEMQDTDKIQNTALQLIFGTGTVLQRLGDVNQTIFNEGSGVAVGTEFPIANHLEIQESKRFSDVIARLASPLAVIKERELAGALHPVVRRHTIFLFDEHSILRVLPAFAQLISEEDFDGYSPEEIVVKVVGSRKSASNENYSPSTRFFPYTIADYWPDFRPSYTAGFITPDYLIDYVRYARHIQQKKNECGEAYGLILEGIVRYLSLRGITNQDGGRLTKLGLRDAIEEYGEPAKLALQMIIRDWCLSDRLLDRSFWLESSQALINFTSYWNPKVPANRATEFIEWTDPNEDGIGDNKFPSKNRQNIFTYEAATRAFNIEVATIHSVKGETHTATLVLETVFNRTYDLKHLVPILYGGAAIDTKLLNRIRRIYVAMTRPTDLLCLAMPKSHLSDRAIDKLRRMQWNFQDLTTESNRLRR